MILVTFLAGGYPQVADFQPLCVSQSFFWVKCFAGVNFFVTLWFFRVFGVDFATIFAPLHFFAVCES